MNFNNIAVIGTGAFGTTIAYLLAINGRNVKIWGREQKIINDINTKKSNPDYLPGIELPYNLEATNNAKEISEYELIINAIPSQFIRPAIEQYKFDFEGKYILNASKGIEKHSLMPISGIFNDISSTDELHYGVLTGPSHAEEVSRKVPTTVVIASVNQLYAEELQSIFSNSFFRVYSSNDVIGCELGGALKNIIAIAAGIIDGLNFGDNTKAALITRGLAEMTRLGENLGADPKTFMGLSGMGDLIVTCNSKHSRNRAVGELIAKGMALNEILENTNTIAEGVYTAESALKLGKNNNIEMPITEQINKILFQNVNPKDAIEELMTRKYKDELL